MDVYERGNAVRVDTVFEDNDGNVVEPDTDGGGHKTAILIEDLDTESVLVDTQMTEISNTEYRHDWQTTTDMEEGEYVITLSASVSQNNVLERNVIELQHIIRD